MGLLSADDYPSIRAALLTSLGEGDLPNEIIGYDIYAGEAQRWVASQITITGPEKTGQRAKLAAIYYTAALLAPALEQVVSQKDTTGESLTLKGFDPVRKEEQLKARAAEMISYVNGGQETGIANRPTMALRPVKSSITVCRIHGRGCNCKVGATLIF